ncbi:MAG: HD domain-containing protein [Desulfovibrionales bacterium]|nr:HD domain-containing protein [Desulfovibrionales bacterium]
MNPSAGLHRVSSALALLALLVAAHLGAAAGDMPGPRVLVVHSYAPDFSWTRDLHAGIVSVLQGPEVQGRYRVEYMDAKRHHSPEYIRQLLGIYRQKYAGERFDGIILTDDHALDLMARHWAELFPGTPMVACGINDLKSIPAEALDTNIVVERLAHQETLQAALKQNPGTRKIFVMVDGTLSGKSILSDFISQLYPVASQVEVEIVPPMAREELIQFARGRSKGELIYLLVYFQDAAGLVFEADEIPRAVSASSPVPVYVAWDFQLDSGAVGGCVTSAFGHGQKAAQILLERLAGGNPPATYDRLQGVNQHTYDYVALQRFGIPLTSLPGNAVLLNRPLSYFEAHRSAILSALVVIGILGVIIVLLVMNVLKQRKIHRGNMEIMALNQEMIDTQVELLTILGEVIETRSQDTANHVRRVAAYSALLGRKYGLAAEDVILLEAASPMHDIGKIGIPDAILHKPGKLSFDEFEKIKHHTLIGQRLLHTSDRRLMSFARTIALQHHERWDGTGYPCGLKGEEISILARICALADVYDALSLGRVYKGAWPRDEVLEFIRQERGGMFDPRIVDLFFENIDELEAIKGRLSDPPRGSGDEGLARAARCPLDV